MSTLLSAWATCMRISFDCSARTRPPCDRHRRHSHSIGQNDTPGNETTPLRNPLRKKLAPFSIDDFRLGIRARVGHYILPQECFGAILAHGLLWSIALTYSKRPLSGKRKAEGPGQIRDTRFSKATTSLNRNACRRPIQEIFVARWLPRSGWFRHHLIWNV